ncbi:tryptophan--tRNA ligase [Flaviflexus massiliensis]|uniref:tryptophan--tRNA ligase n=1 Tax=Flaviflexus massiliensis TaxID=1522309 RepID=UPI0006D5B46B|nr:tryptophan--tRNA ligase [Flaviflexus massiliensis]
MAHDEEVDLETTIGEDSLRHSEKVSEELLQKIQEDASPFRMLTGDRPTGKLHLGHYFGSLKNRVELQKAGVETWLVVADYQVITDRDAVGEIRDRVYGLVTDYLSVGIDPEKAVIFPHSQIPELNELVIPFLSIVTDSELRRNPTVKAELDASGNRPMSGLLLTYPVHQAADILFCKANVVPVGKDQLPHLEQARVIAQRFNKRYGRPKGQKHPIFPRPQALLSEAPSVLGLDGQKMSKSRHNTIELAMTADETAARLKKAVTDSERTITYDPVNRPEVANLVQLTALSTGRDPHEIAGEIGDGGAGTLKKVATEAINEMLAPIRERRAEIEANQDFVRDVLRTGIEKANEQARETAREVHEALQMQYF